MIKRDKIQRDVRSYCGAAANEFPCGTYQDSFGPIGMPEGENWSLSCGAIKDRVRSFKVRAPGGVYGL